VACGVPVNVPVTASRRTVESQRFFQERLALLYAVGFVLSGAFLLGIVLVRGFLGEGIAGELVEPSRWFHVAATVGAGALWWFLARKRREPPVLELSDWGGMLVMLGLLDLTAGLFEVQTVATFNLVLTTGTGLVLRAVLVPSTAGRTLLLGLIASAFAIGIFTLTALGPGWPVAQRSLEDWPFRFQLVSASLWLGSLVATATIASRVIYNLRREVRVAQKLGQYVVRAKLGEGGMGIVYRATHAMLRRETALKLLPPDRVDSAALRRFEREVVQTARLRHPNTVAIYDYGRTPDGVFYYAMEYLEGLTLSQLVSREGPLPPGRVVALLAQVCASLEEAHAAGLVHRDIKPANIMVVGHTAAYDLVKVLDFGLVKTTAAIDLYPSQSNFDKVVGTPLYIAPEAITHPDAVDARSDLYAVAAVGYFMLAGRNVFEGNSVIEICAAHLHDQPSPVREQLGHAVPADLEALLLRGLAKAPTGRPESAAAFRDALLRCNVPAWTEADARAWWQAYDAEPESQPDAAPPEISSPSSEAPTIAVLRLPASAE
jgi:eukaryotic-like serine/threonine-protein kinase